ncbi:carboxypeptidase regulatory-like domain-containing protein [Thalassoroseus pseudoceratinae]|uniref:carboxypeptidase regulatory-like domain-containing protein n=1 Tax=Thalassoroseus pseudoceratinae TaxID=2713176 RepID=UPI00141DF8E2|nr:carboxypeptidase regulatory-like domain-containing protein [Thalassoroseus pseudoceratinae]
MASTLAIFACSLLMGCGGSDNSSLSGTVKFSDGTPLTQGTIVFTSSTYETEARINNDGTFSVEGIGNDEAGAPPGTYKVWFRDVGGQADLSAHSEDGSENEDSAKTDFLVAEKFTTVGATDITKEVESGSNEFEITVEKP